MNIACKCGITNISITVLIKFSNCVQKKCDSEKIHENIIRSTEL